MANFLGLPTHLILETAIFLPFIIVNLRFLTSVLKNLKYQLPVAFSGWLARSKYLLFYLYFGFWLFILWLINQFNVPLNFRSRLILEVVVLSLLTYIVWLSSSDSLVEGNIDSQIGQFIFNGSGYETSTIASDEPFVPNRELSNYTAQTEEFGLNEDIVIEILKNLRTFQDLASCSTICRAWRSACSSLTWSLRAPHPWSIHFQDQNILNRLDDGRYVLERWGIRGRHYYDFVFGLILKIGSANIHIFNISSRTQTNLPMLRVGNARTSDWYRYIDKFILFNASDGGNVQLRVVALCCRRPFIALKIPGFQDWIYLQNRDRACCVDVARLGGRFYALCDRGNLFQFVINRSNFSLMLVGPQLAGSSNDGRYYLVNNENHLIAVFQEKVSFGGERFGTETFRIYRHDNIMNWIRIREPDYLNGRALFISNGNSWMMNPAGVESCRGDSVYFVGNNWLLNRTNGQNRTGLFDIVNETIEDPQFEEDQYPLNDSIPFVLTYNDARKFRKQARGSSFS